MEGCGEAEGPRRSAAGARGAEGLTEGRTSKGRWSLHRVLGRMGTASANGDSAVLPAAEGGPGDAMGGDDATQGRGLRGGVSSLLRGAFRGVVVRPTDQWTRIVSNMPFKS